MDWVITHDHDHEEHMLELWRSKGVIPLAQINGAWMWAVRSCVS
jgi:hypothetical protein